MLCLSGGRAGRRRPVSQFLHASVSQRGRRKGGPVHTLSYITLATIPGHRVQMKNIYITLHWQGHQVQVKNDVFCNDYGNKESGEGGGGSSGSYMCPCWLGRRRKVNTTRWDRCTIVHCYRVLYSISMTRK